MTMDAFMTAVYFGPVPGADPGVGFYNLECLMCGGPVVEDVKATVPAIVARGRAHARDAHGFDGVPVAIRGGQPAR